MGSFELSPNCQGVGVEEQAGESRYLEFPRLMEDAMRDGKPARNRHSKIIARERDFPGAKVRGYVRDDRLKEGAHNGLGHVIRCWRTQ